jgi:hypothetical protein
VGTKVVLWGCGYKSRAVDTKVGLWVQRWGCGYKSRYCGYKGRAVPCGLSGSVFSTCSANIPFLPWFPAHAASFDLGGAKVGGGVRVGDTKVAVWIHSASCVPIVWWAYRVPSGRNIMYGICLSPSL